MNVSDDYTTVQPGDTLGALEVWEFTPAAVEILRFKLLPDNSLALVIDGATVWTGPDSVAFAQWLAQLVAERDALRASRDRRE